ncbi:MAG: replication initiator protein A [Candidatus Nucleicultricaceae bacterium]
MRKFLNLIFEKLAQKTRQKEPQGIILEALIQPKESPLKSKKPSKRTPKKKTEIKGYKENPARDLIEMMEVPFLALSKNRRNPIVYESQDGTRKVKVTRHTGHFLASIYDWDIILFVASKMQDILNSGSDIPPRTMIIPRHEILTAIRKHNVNTQQKELENSLQRLKRTAIDTTIRNEDYRYKSDFGFLDSWEYTERKDIKEIKITLSQWLYDGICVQGSLLKVDPSYFSITSALKRFLYRTARKHVGKNEKAWKFSIEKLYEKSGSEREFKKFKSDLKATVLANDIPGYRVQWIQEGKKSFVLFNILTHIEQIERTVDDIEECIEEENMKFERGDITDLISKDRGP